MADSSKSMRFQTMVLPHLHSAFNLAYWLTRNRQDAEDIVQEAYLRAFKFFDGFHGDDSRAWLLTIVRNTFYTWYWKNRDAEGEMTEFDEEMHSAAAQEAAEGRRCSDDPERLLMAKDGARTLQQALDSLPIEFREVMIMRELEELSYKQIGDIIGIPIGTVMSRLGRGRKLLAQALAPEKREASWITKTR
jgi:RNA polymerase sigma-70 factor (ECF subfamily)